MCTFRCVFCQNHDISTVIDGVEADGEKLASLARHLKREGARNINYVGGDPTPSSYVILDAIRNLARTGTNIVQLWNSNFYCSKELMTLLFDVMDFWLPDFKYGNDNCAETLSKVKKYFDVVSRNHKLAYDETVVDGSSGMIIRHLVMPGHIDCCTKPILEWIAKNTPLALVNVMAQYHPDYLVPRSPEYRDINRRVTAKEMKEAYDYADALGLLWRPVS